ncbi:MAG: hypothetical protein ABGY41_16760, partial [Candidatus Poribacteria bacterium]
MLQILGNLPVSVQNVASLMHPSVTAASQLDTVKKAVEEMLNDVHVPLGENNFFEPGDPDRGQPTYFYPRTNRYQFEVRVPADFP